MTTITAIGASAPQPRKRRFKESARTRKQRLASWKATPMGRYTREVTRYYRITKKEANDGV